MAPKLTYANVMATAAVFIALGGGAYALSLPRASVGSRELKRGAVTSSRLARGAVSSRTVRDRSLRARDFALHQLPAGTQGPQGPRGDQGPPGLTGPGVSRETVRSADSVKGTGAGDVSCQPGEKVLAGGYNGIATGHVYASHPQPADAADPPTGWHVESTSTADDFVLYVVCGSP